MQSIVSNQLLNYEILGKNNKDTILFLHGWGRSLNDWMWIAKKLEKQHRVILLDMPGFGNSALPNLDSFATSDYANLISQFITKLNLKNITLIGHSFGGKISTIIASNNNSIDKLVLIDASGIEKPTTSIKIKTSFTKALKPFKYILPRNISNFILSKLSSDDYKNAGPLKNVLKTVLLEDVSNYAKKIKIPTLIVWGDKDQEVPVKYAKKFKELIPNSHIRIVWNTGHDPFLEKPDKFLEIFYEFP